MRVVVKPVCCHRQTKRSSDDHELRSREVLRFVEQSSEQLGCAGVVAAGVCLFLVLMLFFPSESGCSMLCQALHWGMDTNTLPLAMAQYPSFGGKRALIDEP